ncbi:MAG TPA: FkbM family methyltransferase [Hyphomicrobiaceae bacterium]|nr:FkbM family methyltransferase [Hyphomicrobiaceae bacterium]
MSDRSVIDSLEHHPPSTRALHDRIGELYERMAAGLLTADDVVAADSVALYRRPELIREMFATGTLSGADLSGVLADMLVFKHFKDPAIGTILDVGAHFGYSAVAMRRAGTGCPILSIDALDWHRACLEEIKRLDPVGYDFHIGAVSDQARQLVFYMPVLDGQPLDGFNSAGGAANFTRHHRDWVIANNLGDLAAQPAHTFVFAEARIAAEPLDGLLERLGCSVPTKPIAAMKIDVEGHEPEVLAGAVGVFERDHPFVMIEEGKRNPAVAGFFEAHGYLYADRIGEQVAITTDYSWAVNGCWVHRNRLNEYRAMGLLRAS